MQKSYTVTISTEDNVIAAETILLVSKEQTREMIQVSIGRWQTPDAGDDGETINFTSEEFDDFISELTDLANRLKSRRTNG